MKTTFKLTLSIFTLVLLLSSCGATHRCYEGPEESNIDETTSSKESFKVETPADDVKTKWIPAAERGVNPAEVEPKLATSNESNEFDESDKDENSIKDKKSERERRSKFRKTKRSKIKEIVSAVKKHKNNKRGGEGGLMLVLLIILAILLPPLAVGIYEGITTKFWIVFVLWLIGWVLFGWLFGSLGGIIGLCALAAIICALLIVLGVW